MVQLCDERTQLLKIVSVEAEEICSWRILRSAAIREAPSIRAASCTNRRDQQIRHPPEKSSSSRGRPPSSLKTDHTNQLFNLNMYSVLQSVTFTTILWPVPFPPPIVTAW